MKTLIKKYGQLVIILILIGLIYYVQKDKVDKGTLSASIYVDENINKTNQILYSTDSIITNSLISTSNLSDSVKHSLLNMHILIDSIRIQISDLKHSAIEISGGSKIKDNFYTINNLGYNFGHKNRLTGDKGKNNGEGSLLKANIDRLRIIQVGLISDNSSIISNAINELLNTNDIKEDNSDYMFSFEEQYFKLITTAGIINLLSNLESNILISEQLVLNALKQN
jgi:hypothetical protein